MLEIGELRFGGGREGLCTIYLKEMQPPARNTAPTSQNIALWYISDPQIRFDDPIIFTCKPFL